MAKFKDKAGKELKAGDLIVYGHNLGRCAGLQYGKVIGITETKPRWSDDEPKVKLKVVGVNSDWTWEGAKAQRASCLEFESRVLKINRDQIPADILKILDSIEV